MRRSSKGERVIVWNQQNNEALAREVAFDARLWLDTAQRLMPSRVFACQIHCICLHGVRHDRSHGLCQ